MLFSIVTQLGLEKLQATTVKAAAGRKKPWDRLDGGQVVSSLTERRCMPPEAEITSENMV
jgi:hypothetical protein